MKAFFASYFLYFLYRLFQFTWKIEIRETAALKELLKNDKIFVVAHWHGEELGILHLLKRYRVACMVSQSFDGELVARMIHHFGSKAVRGSSSRGAVQALKGILRLAKEGWRPSVAVDGPRGPRHEVKLGVVEIARVLKVPILPINMACSRSFILKNRGTNRNFRFPLAELSFSGANPSNTMPLNSWKATYHPLHKLSMPDVLNA